MNQLSQFLLEPQLEFRMSPSFSLVSLFWCRVKLWHDVGTDPGSRAKSSTNRSPLSPFSNIDF